MGSFWISLLKDASPSDTLITMRGVVGELLLPQDGGSFQHRGLVRLEEVLGVFLVPGVLKVGEDALPGVPQGRVCREGDDALVADGLILGVLGDIGEEGVVVEQRSDVDDVRVGVARLAHGLIEPVPELLSLLGCVDVLVVLEVVAQDEVGPPLFVPPSADLLARAQRLDLDPVREEDDRRLPDAATSSPKSSRSAAFSSSSVLMSERKPSACSELSERMIS